MTSRLTLLLVFLTNICTGQVIKYQAVGFAGTTTNVSSNATTKHSMSIGATVSQGSLQSPPSNQSGFMWGNLDFRPANQAIGISFSSVSASQLTLSFASGNGARRVVIAKAGTDVDAVVADGVNYTANAAFGSGQQIGSGNFVLFNGGVSDATNVIVTNLNLSTTVYFFKVFEFNGLYGANTSNIIYQSNTATLNPLASPPIVAPAITSFTGLTNNQYTINWTNGNGSKRILLAKKATAVDASPQNGMSYSASPVFGTGTQLSTANYSMYDGTGTSQLLTGLEPNTTYHFLLVEYNGTAGTASYAVSTSANKLTLTDATVTSNGTGITQSSFGAGWSSVTGSTDYFLDVSSDNFSTMVSGFDNKQVTGLTTSVTGLQPGQTYQYRVRASNASGQSANSNVISVLTTPPTPTAASATAVSAFGFTANWGAVTPASSYKLDLSTQSDFSSFVADFQGATVAGTSQVIIGLQSNTTYYFRVRGVNVSGESLNSNSISQLTYPSAPVALPATSPAQTTVVANWDAVTNITDYFLDVSNDNFTTLLTDYSNLLVSATTANITGLSPGTTYQYRVRSSNATGQSANSNTIIQLLVPATPTLSSATAFTTASFTANWQTVQSATEYFIDVSTDNFTTMLLSFTNKSAATSTTQVVNGLLPGITYQYRVRAKNQTGTSPSSAVGNQITVPAQPVNVKSPDQTITSTTIVVNWDAVTGVAGYLLRVFDIAANSFVTGYHDKSIPNNFVSVSGLKALTAYKINVAAVNAAGTSLYSTDLYTATKDISGGSTDPVITITDAGSPTGSVKASITGGFAPIKVVFYHRKLTDTKGDFTAEPEQSITSGVVSTVVNAAWFDEMGMEYYVEAVDLIQKSVKKSGYVYALPAQTQFAYSKSGGGLKDYVMFSIPFKLRDESIENIFDPVIGKYDKKQWRLVRYQNGRNTDYTEGLSKIELAKGYWLNSKQKVDINLQGDLVQANGDTPYELKLEKEWNQIGDPFPFGFDWADVLADPNNLSNASKVDPTLLSWDPGITNFKPVGFLKPWEGAFVYATEAVTLKLPVSLKQSFNGRKSQPPVFSQNLEDEKWFVSLTLTQGESMNTYIGLGMHPDASPSKDLFDLPAPPRFLSFLEMYTHHKEYSYPWFTKDVVPTSSNYTWTFTMESNFEEKEIELSWDNKAFGENEAVLFLYDVDEQVIVNMKRNFSYVFKAVSKKEIKFLFSSDEKSLHPDTNGLGQPFPNPFSSQLTIPILVSDQSNVSVDIFDLTGRKVRELSLGLALPGYYELTWDGTDRDGQALPGGLYLTRMHINGVGSVGFRRLIKK